MKTHFLIIAMLIMAFVSCDNKKQTADIIPQQTSANSLMPVEDMDYPIDSATMGRISIYSIPSDEYCGYANYYRNTIKYRNYKNQTVLDTMLLHDDFGSIVDIYQVSASNGKPYYLVKTEFGVLHQGIVVSETIHALSFNEKGELVKVPLFKTRKASYDEITVSCGGQRWLPMDFDELCLIYVDADFDNNNIERILLAEINENDWPTGYGLEYTWNGNCFAYQGKCKYDANEFSVYE